MTPTRRSIPNDIFSVEHKGATIRIICSYDAVHVSTGHVDGSEFSMIYSFDEFHSALEALLMGAPPSPPSQPDKEATAPAVDTKQATPDTIP